jgi:hypothetical protein
LRKIELPSEKLAEELQRHLQDKRFAGATFDDARKVIQFPERMNPSQWSSLKDTVEKWAKGKRMEVVESLELHPRPEAAEEESKPNEPETEAKKKLEEEAKKKLEEEAKKKLEGLTPKEAEERYNLLLSKSVSELTDAEFEERLALAQRGSGKAKGPK